MCNVNCSDKFELVVRCKRFPYFCFKELGFEHCVIWERKITKAGEEFVLGFYQTSVTRSPRQLAENSRSIRFAIKFHDMDRYGAGFCLWIRGGAPVVLWQSWADSRTMQCCFPPYPRASNMSTCLAQWSSTFQSAVPSQLCFFRKFAIFKSFWTFH